MTNTSVHTKMTSPEADAALVEWHQKRFLEVNRIASHALGAIAGGDIYPQKLAREALALMRTSSTAPQGVGPEPAESSVGTTPASKQCPHCTGLIPAACKCDCDENDMYCPHMADPLSDDLELNNGDPS